MTDSSNDLDALQRDYKQAVESWVAAIRQEEALASVAHDVAQVDDWEAAGFREEAERQKVKAAKRAYEDELRRAHFDF
jgi:hypothetical protein